ncbi:MAG: NAD-dependent epimerase/dehydratase family protein [Phycisphaerales bacterium]|jgi:GDP-L-fucose synthase|nr:NAD-dependent epimerase/dehydratase family protein [Phycisphaerales bacterium]
MSLEGKKIVVTGGRGFLGGFVCKALEQRGAEVVAIGSSDYDLINQEDVARMYQEQQPQLVVHLAAACGGIGANVENPARFLYENAMMGLMLLEEGRQNNLQKFVLISTTCSYPKDAPLPLQEDSIWTGKPVGATGPYGMAKRLLHEACETYGRQYDLPCAVLVPANLYGPEDHFEEEKSHVIPAIIRRYVEAKDAGLESVSNWGTGSPTREFLHVADAAEAIAIAAEKEVDCVPINLGTGIETSISDLTELIASTVGYEGEVVWDTSKPDGQPKRFLDVSRAKELLGFESKISLEDGIKETVEWYRQNPV